MVGRTSDSAAVHDRVPKVGIIDVRPGDIAVFLGDSISTLTYQWWALYRASIDSFYAKLGLPAVTWFVEAVGGNTMSGCFNRIADVLAHNPTLVFVEAGINDAAQSIDPATTADRMVAIHTALRAQLAGMRIATCGPWINGLTNDDSAGNLRIRATNKAMRDVAIERGTVYVDWRAHFEALPSQADADAASLTSDQVHPTDPAGRGWLSGKVMRQTRLLLS